LLALREVQFGNHRFNQIVRNTGAPRDRMAARLKQLVDAGVLQRRRYPGARSNSAYHLTESGHDLAPVLRALREWGDAWLVTRPPLTLTHHGHPLKPVTTCVTCGELFDEADLERTCTAPSWDLSGPVSPEVVADPTVRR
jgi:DNA-binding HxlR family transcriptional regulator